jgi:hypothetical protein
MISCPFIESCREFVDKCQMFDRSISSRLCFFGRGQGCKKETGNLTPINGNLFSTPLRDRKTKKIISNLLKWLVA